jgi:hypothetical protein
MAQTVQQQLEESVKQLSTLSESELELELGKRLSKTAREVDSAPALTMSQPQAAITTDAETLQAFPAVLRQVAQRFLTNFNAQMYSLVCESADEDNKKLRAAAKTSVESLGLFLSGFFVATFGWLPGIASILAVLVAKRFANSAYDAVCKVWKDQI